MRKRILVGCILAAVLLLSTGCSSLLGGSSMLGGADESPKTTEQAHPDAEDMNIPTKPEEPANTVILHRSDVLGMDYYLTAMNPWAQYLGEQRTINSQGAEALIRWLLTQDARDLVAEAEGCVFRLSDRTQVYSGWISPAQNSTKEIRMLVDRDLVESGLLDELVAAFRDAYGYEVALIAKSAEEIYPAAMLGEGDLILAKAPLDGEILQGNTWFRQVPGFAEAHLPIFRCPYVLCGPSEDPAGVAKITDLEKAFSAIAKSGCYFISRGDGSDIHKAEVSLWADAPEGDWYFPVDAKMGPCLVIAEEMGGYVLADELTFSLFAAENGIIG